MQYSMFSAVVSTKYWQKFGCPKMGTWVLYNEFGSRYDQHHFRNEFLGHTNISTDTFIEVVTAIVCLLCHYVYNILKSEKFRLSGNGYLGAIQ